MQRKHVITSLLIIMAFCFSLSAANERRVLHQAQIGLSLQKEAVAAIDRGADYLLQKQQENGAWLQSPAVTGLACIALHQSSTAPLDAKRQQAVDKARNYILGNVQEDGAICTDDRSYVNYSTAICLSTLAILNREEDIPVMRKARKFLIGLQLDEDNEEHPTQPDNPFYGGIGYGSGGPTRPDLSNTQLALEALYLTDHLDREPYNTDPKAAKQADLAWDNALQFLASVQNLPESEDGVWIISGEKDGGFIYRPDQSKASAKGEETLRSYGSMTYAGLKSMIYAKLEKDDPRVQAAVDWARKHYTVDENPGMKNEGYYYYLQTFAKAHAAYREEVIVTDEGEKHFWREDLIRRLLQLQKGDGQWHNDKSGRWQESIPELVTAYALISIEIALGDQLP